MKKQLLKSAGALALCLVAGSSWAQDAAGALREPKALSCDKPAWNQEARRYELEGSTAIAFDLDNNGVPTNPRVERSSGWRLLDRMSLAAVSSCRYAPPTDPAFKRAGLKLAYNWKLTPANEKQVPASLVAGSCVASDRYTDFRPLSGDVTRSEGLLVRFLLKPTGTPFGVHIEGNTSPEVYQATVAYLESCRFTPASTNSVPGPGNMIGRLLPKSA